MSRLGFVTFARALLAGVLILAPPLTRAEEAPPLGPCALIPGDARSCVRTLACIGTQGLWFDGQALGWGQGALIGFRSDGVYCSGRWGGRGLLNTVPFAIECEDGLTAQGLYYAQDGPTGTGIARGIDSQGRGIEAWSGRNVLAYLGDGEPDEARLSCTADPIPMF